MPAVCEFDTRGAHPPANPRPDTQAMAIFADRCPVAATFFFLPRSWNNPTVRFTLRT